MGKSLKDSILIIDYEIARVCTESYRQTRCYKKVSKSVQNQKYRLNYYCRSLEMLNGIFRLTNLQFFSTLIVAILADSFVKSALKIIS